ncbi:molybdenum cofactor guanylyltransferase [Mesorhizobium sp. Root554]|uniref:molybdenum cofactor guanylyltransferase MobA n=1 Tax=unclassified Mesorhizobium TaxID=325217 RepID=UPI0006FA959E|nr:MULTISPECIES: molybdenum cofactor guanylyltransferase MobA [unclassified Mesorhizobium]KQZ13399.1 molybdenum cofactor guanylyltransferase [Mesorhizobium sp. Root1471]KQZ35912.1 molybdenum cofactor guanylyltransferase [Mesorhizobium sp. Root554]
MTIGIAGTILAGGLSQRMGGGDKGLLMIGDQTVLHHVARRMAPQVEALALNANGDVARFAQLGLTTVADGLADFPGPLAGILAAMEWAAGLGFNQVATIAGDTPFLPTDFVARLAASLSDASEDAIAVASSAGRPHPTSALWPVGLRHALRHAITDDEERRVTAFINRYPNMDVEFPIANMSGIQVDPFFNINTPAELAEARRIASSMDP